MTHRLWLALQLVTGRRHQARAHLAWLGWPIEGDSVYGGTVLAGASPRLRLHAQRLDLRAVAGDERPVQAPLPPDLAARLATLGLPPI
jgi:23S rRNA-/tRNA-specific pseudouridylate synthase